VQTTVKTLALPKKGIEVYSGDIMLSTHLKQRQERHCKQDCLSNRAGPWNYIRKERRHHPQCQWTLQSTHN